MGFRRPYGVPGFEPGSACARQTSAFLPCYCFSPLCDLLLASIPSSEKWGQPHPLFPGVVVGNQMRSHGCKKAALSERPSIAQTQVQGPVSPLPLAANTQRGRIERGPVGPTPGRYPQADTQEAKPWSPCVLCVSARISPPPPPIRTQFLAIASKFPNQSQGRTGFSQSSFRVKLSLVLGNLLWLSQPGWQEPTSPPSSGRTCPQTTSLPRPHWDDMFTLSPDPPGNWWGGLKN